MWIIDLLSTKQNVIELSFSNFKSPLEFFDAGGRFEVMLIERKLNNIGKEKVNKP